MDAWQVGINLTLTNGVSSALSLIAKEVLGLDGHVSNLIKKFKELSTTAKWGLTGGAAVGLGVGLGEAYKKVAEHGVDLLDAQDKLVRAGVDHNKVLKITSEYYEKIGKSIPTADASDFLNTLNEIKSAVGISVSNIEDAIPAAIFSTKLDALMSNTLGGHKEGAGFSLYRAVEARGKFVSDPEGSSVLLAALAQNVNDSPGGKLDPAEFYTMSQRMKGVWQRLSPEFLVGTGSVLAQEFGGQGAGTALMSLEQMLMGSHTLSQQQYDVLKKSGLVDPTKVTTDRAGRINMAPGAIMGSIDGIPNPDKWVTDVFAPAIKKLGLKLSKDGKVTGKNAAAFQGLMDSLLGKVGSNRNVFGMLEVLSDPEQRAFINKEIANYRAGMTVDKANDDFVNNDPKGVTLAYEKQKEAMFQAIGGPFMQAAIPVMQGITGAFTSIGAWADSHKELAGQIAVITAGLSALATAIGGFALSVAASRTVLGLFGGGAAAAGIAGAAGGGAVAGEAAGGGGFLSSLGLGSGGLFAGAGTIILPFLAASWLFRNSPLYDPTIDYLAKNGTKVPGAPQGSGWYPGAGPSSGVGAPMPFGLYPGAAPAINVSPTITGNANINIDGKKVASAILPLIMDKIGSLISHPNSAPMASSSSGAPAFDSSHGGF